MIPFILLTGKESLLYAKQPALLQNRKLKHVTTPAHLVLVELPEFALRWHISAISEALNQRWQNAPLHAHHCHNRWQYRQHLQEIQLGLCFLHDDRSGKPTFQGAIASS